jgi:Ser/Thr protein kinase RdoA (MazF antagonist)
VSAACVSDVAATIDWRTGLARDLHFHKVERNLLARDGRQWDALEQWGEDAIRLHQFTGGSSGNVWSVRVRGRLAVARLSTRDEADLAWESALRQHLDREGLTVPGPTPTSDGRLFADGLMVMTYIEGGPPKMQDDWSRVADTLRRLHQLTEGWPQRPDWRSSTDLLNADSVTRIDLTAMPPEAAVRCRAAGARLDGRRTCVVHGNANTPDNLRMNAERVGLIDWDETHVDIPDLDLVLPFNAAGLDNETHDIASQASAA